MKLSKMREGSIIMDVMIWTIMTRVTLTNLKMITLKRKWSLLETESLKTDANKQNANLYCKLKNVQANNEKFSKLLLGREEEFQRINSFIFNNPDLSNKKKLMIYQIMLTIAW